MKAVSELSNGELLKKTVALREREKEILHSLLLYLGEVDERKLYRDEGYSSFYSYLTNGLHYSNSGAYRRIEAARLLRRRPELYQKLTSEELSFSSLVELSKCRDKDSLPKLVAKSTNKPFTEVAKLVEQERAPEVPLKRKERVRVIRTKEAIPSATLLSQTTSASEVEPKKGYELAFQVDEEFMKLYQEAKAVAGGMSMSQVMKRILKDYISRNSPKEKMKRREERRQKSRNQKASVSSPTSRHIPVAARDEVIVRDDCQCTYVSPKGVRCSETTNLQVDHIKPFALGGSHKPSNLRLLCQSHNQLAAERVYGKEYMNQYQQRE